MNKKTSIMIPTELTQICKLFLLLSLLLLTSCNNKEKEPVMECMIDSFISLYDVNPEKVDLILNENQSISDSLITFGINSTSRNPSNNHPEQFHSEDFYYSEYRGFRIYLKRNYHVGGRTWDASKVSSKKYLSNNLKWKKMKFEIDTTESITPVSDIFESISVEYDIKNNKINKVIQVMGYEKFIVNDSCPYIIVDRESRINDFYK